MINIEAARDGFVLNFGDRKILAHSRRAPCIEIGWAERRYRQRGGAFKLARARGFFRPLRAFKVAENGPDFAAIDFEGLLRMAIRLEGGRLRLSFARFDAGVELFRLRLQAPADERVFAGGARGGSLDLKRGTQGFWVEHRATGRPGVLTRRLDRFFGYGPHPDSASCLIPALFSSQGYYLVVDASTEILFDLRRRTQTLVEAWSVPREIIVGAKSDAASLIGDLSATLGRQPAAPAWVFDGAIVGFEGAAAATEAALEPFYARGAKLAALVLASERLDVAEEGACGSSSASGGRARPLRLLGRADPYLATSSPAFADAAAAGLLVRKASGEPYILASATGPIALFDLSQPAAVSLLKSRLVECFTDRGFSGWLAEGGELLPADALLASGEDARAVHNRWPLLWARLCREALAPAGADAVFFMRSGWLGSARYATSLWVEALPGRGGGLAAALRACLSLGLSGFGSAHVEIGPPRRGKAALEPLRAMEVAAFSPLFRVRGLGAAPPHPDYVAHLARMSEVFSALKPYHLAVAAEYDREGLPSMRHPYLHYEDEPGLLVCGRQYLYGRDLLVALPVRAEADCTELLLPQDEWVHLWSSRRFRGGPVAVESGPGFPAVFYRTNSPFASLFDAVRRTTRKV